MAGLSAARTHLCWIRISFSAFQMTWMSLQREPQDSNLHLPLSSKCGAFPLSYVPSTAGKPCKMGLKVTPRELPNFPTRSLDLSSHRYFQESNVRIYNATRYPPQDHRAPQYSRIRGPPAEVMLLPKPKPCPQHLTKNSRSYFFSESSSEGGV